MEDVIALGFGIGCLVAAISVVALGTIILRSAARDILDLIVQLPTRPVREETTEGREVIRRRARNEAVFLIFMRSWPGWLLIVSGLMLLGYIIVLSPRN